MGPTGSFDRKLAVSGEWGRIPILEVVMRPPEVFVRPLSHQEAVRLKRMSTRAEHQSTRIRAAILLASNVRTPVPQIARMWLTDESHVRKVIHEFNEEGFDSLRPDYRGGRPRRITPAQRKRVVAVAGARPDTQGVPLTRWSLDRLSAHLGRGRRDFADPSLAAARRGGPVVPAHPLVEGQPRSRLRGQGRPGAGAVRAPRRSTAR